MCIHSKNIFRKSNFWQKLLTQKQLITQNSIAQLFLKDHNRFNDLSINLNNLPLCIDFSKQYVNLNIINTLCEAAQYCDLEDRIKDLFNGAKLNLTENKKVWHTALREPNPIDDIALVLQKISRFTDYIYKSNYKNILCLGIGGSYLGPNMVCQALNNYTNTAAKGLNFHFIANTDQETIDKILTTINPETTIAIINSKSFTTKETLNNSKIIINWFKETLPLSNYQKKVFAVTCNVNKAIEFGILEENIFQFWDFIGGRYSVWSAVGLPIAIKLGIDNFKQFLNGAYLMDQHFKNTNFSNNAPLLMALIGIWNINFMKYRSLAIMPYLDSLEQFPAYLQQLEMESNGKTVDLQGNFIDYDTAPIIWGGVGCNGQHSYMQMLHQGSQIVPVDFLVAANNNFLFANSLAQSQALMQGTLHQAPCAVTTNSTTTYVENFKECLGNRPNSIILFPKLTPKILGALIALYEHKTFVQGIMWNINSFDQWGVELGKTLANTILSQLSSRDLSSDLLTQDNPLTESMLGLINIYSYIKEN